jgi:hypothetical protein
VRHQFTGRLKHEKPLVDRCTLPVQKGAAVPEHEQRNYPRLNTAVTVQDLATSRTGVTANLSLGGCFIRKSPAFALLPIPSRISLQLELPGISETVVVFGMVIHTGGHEEGFGVQFKELHKKSAYCIAKCIGTFL